jgi:hypothetical protein
MLAIMKMFEAKLMAKMIAYEAKMMAAVSPCLGKAEGMETAPGKMQSVIEH